MRACRTHACTQTHNARPHVDSAIFVLFSRFIAQERYPNRMYCYFIYILFVGASHFRPFRLQCMRTDVNVTNVRIRALAKQTAQSSFDSFMN